MERKYSVSEIDRMRTVCKQLALEHLVRPPHGQGHLQRAAIAEDLLRTYMMNGTEPEDLERAVAEKLAQGGFKFKEVFLD